VQWLSHVVSLAPANLRDAHYECVVRAAAAGAKGVEVPLAHAAPFLHDLPADYWKQFTIATQIEGLKIVSAHGPTFPAYDRASPSEAACAVVELARACAEAEIPVLVVHPTYHPAIHVTRHALRALEYDAQVAGLIGEQITGLGVRVAIENVPHNSWKYLELMFERIDHPLIGMCFDTGHYQVRPELSLERVMQLFGSRIIHLHFSDNDGLSDQHQPPGRGVFPWANWLPIVPARLLENMLIEVSTPVLIEDPNAPVVERDIFIDTLQKTRLTLDPILDQLHVGAACVSR